MEHLEREQSLRSGTAAGIIDANTAAAVSQDVQQTDHVLEVTIAVMFVCYGGLLCAVLHNIIRFVFMQQRYRFLHIAYFYALVSLVILTRLFWLGIIFGIAYRHQDTSLSESQKVAVFSADIVATYLELLLGV